MFTTEKNNTVFYCKKEILPLLKDPVFGLITAHYPTTVDNVVILTERSKSNL